MNKITSKHKTKQSKSVHIKVVGSTLVNGQLKLHTHGHLSCTETDTSFAWVKASFEKLRHRNINSICN